MDVPDRVAAQELGTIAHGPMLIAADKGIVVGVRCVFAHSTGLHLPIVLVARGVNADAARRRLREHGDELRLTLGPSGTAQVRVTAFATQSASSEDEYRQESAYWYSGLPDSAILSLTVSWPEIGLPTTTAVLEVPNLATSARGALPLLGQTTGDKDPPPQGSAAAPVVWVLCQPASRVASSSSLLILGV